MLRLFERVELAGGPATVEGGAMKQYLRHSIPARFAAGPSPEGERPASGCTDAHLAAINAMPGVLKPLTAADVYVRRCVAINDLPLKNGLQLGAAELAAIAQMSPGHGIHVNHDIYTSEGGLPLGRIFAAVLTSASGRSQVEQDFYLMADDETTDLVARIDAGVITEVSVSFAYDQLICSICQTDLAECAHWPMEVYDGKTCMGMVRGVNEYFETSLVWQGMANETSIRMAANHVLFADADLVEFFAKKPRTSDLEVMLAGNRLDAMFERGNQKLEGLFTK